MAYVPGNLNNVFYKNANRDFKSLWTKFILGRKIKTEDRYIFSRAEILLQLNIHEDSIPTSILSSANTDLEVFPTLENNTIIIYLDGLNNGGGVGNVPPGLARNPNP
jgi:hypothetical protein